MKENKIVCAQHEQHHNANKNDYLIAPKLFVHVLRPTICCPSVLVQVEVYIPAWKTKQKNGRLCCVSMFLVTTVGDTSPFSIPSHRKLTWSRPMRSRQKKKKKVVGACAWKAKLCMGRHSPTLRYLRCGLKYKFTQDNFSCYPCRQDMFVCLLCLNKLVFVTYQSA